MDDVKERWLPGEAAHFEYHCEENDESEDAPAWRRSHQVVTVLGEEDSDAYGEESTFEQRCEWCTPRLYRVRFADGLEWSVFEDELLTGPEAFQRPAPPVGGWYPAERVDIE